MIKLSDILFENTNDAADVGIEEMPIQQFKTIGDFSKRSSFGDETDRKLLTSPKAVEKIHKQWEKTPYDFDLYFINSPRVNKSEFREIGAISLDFLRNQMKITPEEIPDPSGDTITVIYTGNSGLNRYMASGWILAHRFSHALSLGSESIRSEWEYFQRSLRKIFADIMRDVYGVDLSRSYDFKQNNNMDKILKYVAQQMGTMKSARDGNLNNWYEFSHELVAQYLLTGNVKLKPIPDTMVTKIGSYGRKEISAVKNQRAKEMHTEQLTDYEAMIEGNIENLLSRAVGDIFVI